MLKSKKAKLWTAILGVVLVCVAILNWSIMIGLVAVFLICLGGFPKTIKIMIKLLEKVWGAFKTAIYEVSHAAAKGIADGKGKKKK